jgi:hypothetical protein
LCYGGPEFDAEGGPELNADYHAYFGLQSDPHDHGSSCHPPGIEPRSISFKGAVQTLEAFQPVIALQGEHDAEFLRSVYKHLLDAIASHRVADRPDRFEPRRRKRRPKPYDRLMKPRHEAKREMLNGFREN